MHRHAGQLSRTLAACALDLTAIQTFTEPGNATAVQIGFSRRIGPGDAHP